MPVRAWLGRVLGHVLLFALAAATVTVALRPELWWILLLNLLMLWLQGFNLSHSYILAHDGIGSRQR